MRVDLPGHGKSGCFDSTHTMEEMAEAVLAIIKHLEIPKPTFLDTVWAGMLH